MWDEITYPFLKCIYGSTVMLNSSPTICHWNINACGHINAGLLLIVFLGTTFGELQHIHKIQHIDKIQHIHKIQRIHKTHLELPSAKCCPFYLGDNILRLVLETGKYIEKGAETLSCPMPEMQWHYAWICVPWTGCLKIWGSIIWFFSELLTLSPASPLVPHICVNKLDHHWFR